MIYEMDPSNDYATGVDDSFSEEDAYNATWEFEGATGIAAWFSLNKQGAYEFETADGFTCEYPWELDAYRPRDSQA